ncbi:MAG: glycine cleavage system protein R [Candidatus Schekmanbacteria bacterium]|nr:glycine cleavage system protein R [Candidatus Schekmanbacteria bacterium]
MRESVLITLVSPDRAGLVERITKVILDCGGNLEQSRMARLGGDFAGILLVSIDESALSRLMTACEQLDEEGLRLFSRTTDAAAATGRFAGFVPHEIVVTGADHEGIVHAIAAFLAHEGANVEELSASVSNAPLTGAPLFAMRALVAIPPSVGGRRLREALERLADELAVDVDIKLHAGGGATP